MLLFPFSYSKYNKSCLTWQLFRKIILQRLPRLMIIRPPAGKGTAAGIVPGITLRLPDGVHKALHGFRPTHDLGKFVHNDFCRSTGILFFHDFSEPLELCPPVPGKPFLRFTPGFRVPSVIPPAEFPANAHVDKATV